LWLICAAVLATIPLGGLAFWMIAMLRGDHGFDAADATLWVLGLFLIQVPGAVFIGKLGDRCARGNDAGKPQLLLALTVLVCPCYLIGFHVSWGTAVPLSAACIVFCGLVLSGAFLACGLPPLWFNAVGDINLPEKRGVVFGMLNFSQLVGRAIGVQWVAWLSTTWHSGQISPAIGWLAILFLPSAACLWPVVRSARRDRQRLSVELRDYVHDADVAR
jgi:sugar phosphate permease